MGKAYVVSTPPTRTLRALNFVPEVEAFRERAGSSNTLRLGSVLAALGPAYARGFTRYRCSAKHGEELLSQSDMFAAEPRGRFIRGDMMRGLEDYRIRRWQVLIAGNGTLGENELYGRAIIADGRLEGKLVGSDANVLVFDEPGGTTNLYVYAFLCSRVGLQAIRSCSYGTKNLRHRLDILADLPIPLPSEETTMRVAELVRTAVLGREEYVGQLRAARTLIEELPDVREAEEMSRGRHARCMLWGGDLPTFQAWTYASVGEALKMLGRRWSGRLRDMLVSPMEHGSRFARTRCEAPHGVDFLSQRDIFMMRPVGQRILLPASATDMLATPGGLLIAGDGQLSPGALFGRVQIVGAGLAGKAVTEHAVRVHPALDHAAILYAFLSTELGLRLLRTTAFGTSIPKMNTALAADLPVPDLDTGTARNVKEHVDRAISARSAANAAEAEAIRIVEDEVVPAWLA